MKSAPLVAFVLVCQFTGLAAWAQPPGPASRSVIDRISGFDSQRIEAIADWLHNAADRQLISEAAKLLYQVNRLADTSLARTTTDTVAPGDTAESLGDVGWQVGDAVTIRGRALGIAAAQVPPELAEVLEFNRIYRIEMALDPPPGSAETPAATGPKVYIIATTIPAAWIKLWSETKTLDQPMAATGMVISPGDQSHPRLIATPAVAWFPSAGAAMAEDWALLAEQGFDVSLIEQIRSRDRKPLLAADQTAFYAMLRAAGTLGTLDLPAPPDIDAAELLKNSAISVGRRVRLHCQSVRITRVTINSPDLQAALGADHYWQIDALGELGNVVIRIELEAPAAEPVVFENRYPVSIATLHLPDFLASHTDAVAGAARNDVLMLSHQLLIEGFFYRLWSYESDLMRQHGGAAQFGPLVMASRIIDNEPPRGDVVGVGSIGQAAAIVTVLMMLAAGLWIYFTSRQDAVAKSRRGLPSDEKLRINDLAGDSSAHSARRSPEQPD